MVWRLMQHLRTANALRLRFEGWVWRQMTTRQACDAHLETGHDPNCRDCWEQGLGPDGG